MRIISQNKANSVNMDNCIISVEGACIIAHDFDAKNKGVILGVYNSEDRVSEVFEVLNREYGRTTMLSNTVFNMPEK